MAGIATRNDTKPPREPLITNDPIVAMTVIIPNRRHLVFSPWKKK